MPTPALVQSVFKSGGAATSSSIALPNPVTAGDMILALLLVSSTSSGALGVSDNINGSYGSPIVAGTESTTVNAGLWIFPNAGAGATTLNFTQTTGTAQIRLYAAEISGIVAASPLDGTPGSHSNGLSTSFLTGSTTSAVNGDLIVACMFQTNGTTPSAYPSGFTSDTPTGLGKIFPCYQFGAPAGAYSGTYTLPTNDQGLGIIAAFQAAGVVPDTTMGRCIYILP